MNQQNSSRIKAETQYQPDFRGPDFIIIGGMKCGTSTLSAQLKAQKWGISNGPKRAELLFRRKLSEEVRLVSKPLF